MKYHDSLSVISGAGDILDLVNFHLCTYMHLAATKMTDNSILIVCVIMSYCHCTAFVINFLSCLSCISIVILNYCNCSTSMCFFESG